MDYESDKPPTPVERPTAKARPCPTAAGGPQLWQAVVACPARPETVLAHEYGTPEAAVHAAQLEIDAPGAGGA